MSSNIRRVSGSFVCAILIALLLSSGAFGQVADGNLVGTILDSSGAAVPGAMVEVENMATGVKNTVTTDENGVYRVNNLLVGKYNVKASKPGFTSATVTQVAIELSKTTTANVTIAVGGVTTEIRVTESPALIDTTTAQVQSTY